MGNLSFKNEQAPRNATVKRVAFEEKSHSSQFSLSNFVGNLSGRSFLSVSSSQSAYSASRPWSRVSRKRWSQSTLNSSLEASKTAWPVSQIESIFLPEFPTASTLQQKDYQIGDCVAKGAFGEVYKVKSESNGKDFALKVLLKAQIVNENAVRQIKEEVRIQESCGHHSFIVGLVAKWQTRPRLYIVSEYLGGGELWSLLESYGRLPEELVKVYVAELALVIDFLHSAGVIYRDLKPENVLLDEECHLNLIDFGLSKWLSYGYRTNTICGTLKYMAPEVLSREPYGHAVDWWSLGVIACRMLTGQFPSPVVDHDNISHEESDLEDYKPGRLPPGAKSIAEAARKLLIHLLEADPKHRLKTFRQLEQSAFFMKFNFADVRSRKISPKALLHHNFPDGSPTINVPEEDISEELRSASHDLFSAFDTVTLV